MCPQVLQSCGSPELVRSIISPHLSKDTVDFLRGNLSPKEMTIFELLGEGWTKPRYIYVIIVNVCQDGQLKGRLLSILLLLLFLLQIRVAKGSVCSTVLPQVS